MYNHSMSEYLNKIYFKLNKSDLYSSEYDSQVADLSKKVRLDIMPTNAPKFEDTVLSWSGFADMVLKLISSRSELSYENLGAIYAPKPEDAKPFTPSRAEVDPSLLVEEDPAQKMNRLLEIAEENDILDVMDPSFLTIEGFRSTGSIDKLDTELDGYDLKAEDDSGVPIVRVKKDEDIISPFTGSTNIYRIDEVTFLDIETDEIFKVFVY